ncbi:hypothetical protein G647_05887 [Cladophialophora carrionii CBS 160.54]|uniref:Uncharacterized protein n=1 Tax=Cladophialophora carrionii CBS 160.54 TaxID=1279043 RepID=V9D689_9EURO|nr:uncharacterized protein G647_05887 [Cladophialophora carrionii CBS 160.54]ETI21818.1 hypothetical protein G647_05887 [Cladophialophora carrionii CBS 160.54]
MNAARQVISRRFVSGMGPRLTTPARYASTSVEHHGLSPQDKKLMRSVFTAGTLAVAGGVAYGAARSGGRVGNRFMKRNSTLDSSKWFAEGSDTSRFFGSKH